MSKKAIILAAGKSTRTYPLTLTRPKPLLKVANKAILAHQLEGLKEVVEGVVVVVGYMGDMIREAFGDTYGGLPIEYVEQREQKGTGHAVLMCADVIDDPFIVINGDDLYATEDLLKLSQCDEGSLVKTVEDPRNFCIYEVADGDRVLRIVEKPTDIFSTTAGIGAYRFRQGVFDVLSKTAPSARGEIEITSAIQTLADEGEYRVVEAEGLWLPIGYPWDLLSANERLLDGAFDNQIQGEVKRGSHITGKVSIGKGTLIRPGVVIDGPVMIGEDCVIGPNCWLRPHTTIGSGCKVGQGVEIKGSIIMDGARVPHLSYVGDSVVGCDANLGCGTVTANFRHDGANHKSMVKGELVDTGRRKLGAIIGDGVHTGINTSIYPGRKLWPHTRTLPGEVVREDKME